LSKTVGLGAIITAVKLADGRFIMLALLTMTVAGGLKAFRWGVLLRPGQKHLPFSSLFWATWLGQFVNIAMPFMRLGEFARVYALNHQTDISKVRSIGTLVVEKSLDLVMLALTIAILLPLIILPDFIQDSSLILAGIAAFLFISLYLLAYKTELVIRLCQWGLNRLPGPIGKRLMPIIISGLEGLASLRNQRATAVLILVSAIIALFSFLTPFILFFAFHFDLGLAAAALIDTALSITTTPPSTPAQLGVFEGTVVLVLRQFGQFGQQTDGADLISYAIIYHLVVLLPKIVLGSIAAARTDWKWQRDVKTT
jgi:uncharacterized protein (TIRG00374 family)